MSRFVLDTDTLVLFQVGHEAVCRRLLSESIRDLAVTVISVEEQLSGWYTLLRRAKDTAQLASAFKRLAETAQMLGQFPVLSFTEPAIRRFEHLKTLVRDQDWTADMTNSGPKTKSEVTGPNLVTTSVCSNSNRKEVPADDTDPRGFSAICRRQTFPCDAPQNRQNPTTICVIRAIRGPLSFSL